MDLGLNNLQRLICHETQQPTNNHELNSCIKKKTHKEARKI